MSGSFTKDMRELAELTAAYIDGKSRKADTQQKLDALLVAMGYLRGFRNPSCCDGERCCGMRGMSEGRIIGHKLAQAEAGE